MVTGHGLHNPVPQSVIVDNSTGVKCCGFGSWKLYLSPDHTSAAGSGNAKSPVAAFVDCVGGNNLDGVSVARFTIPPTSPPVWNEAAIDYRGVWLLLHNHTSIYGFKP